MVDDNSEERSAQTFDLELNASQMIALNTILQHVSFDSTNHEYSVLAQGIGHEVVKTLASEKFNDAMEEELDYIKEREAELQQEQSMNIPGHGRGVQ